jgi:rhamnogalacturonan endolyase
MSIRKVVVVLTAAALVPLGLAAVSTPASAAAGCRVVYTVTSQWQGGFGASVAVTNVGDPLNGWTLGWSFPSGQTITQLWNGVASQSGAAVTVRDAGYNAALATGASTSFGFNGASPGANTDPSAFTLNGVACTGGTVPSTPPSTPPQRRLDQRHQPRRAHPDQR